MWISVEPSRAMSYNHNIRPIPITVVTGSVNRERGEEMVAPFPESFIAAGRSELGLKQGEIKWMIMDSEKEGDDWFGKETGVLEDCADERENRPRSLNIEWSYYPLLCRSVVSFAEKCDNFAKWSPATHHHHHHHRPRPDRTKLLTQTNSGLCQPSNRMGCLEWRGWWNGGSEASHTYLLRELFAQLLFADSFRTKANDCFVSRSATTVLSPRSSPTLCYNSSSTRLVSRPLSIFYFYVYISRTPSLSLLCNNNHNKIMVSNSVSIYKYIPICSFFLYLSLAGRKRPFGIGSATNLQCTILVNFLRFRVGGCLLFGLAPDASGTMRIIINVHTTMQDK